ncbi:hypothetical protein [Micropruina sonneratiae]|uniref:hypothetical protein n=1 Tax=Micropruina sonneratiae TaxID=2986940 RepID=UPI0022277043|nr:hypothetical protein [Micropruina sp. KQZ13P-5]MCW3156421.1 hypothetical protein [Micropruina sp. KQZ13P-5]
MATATPSDAAAAGSGRAGIAAVVLNSVVALLLGGAIAVLLHNLGQWVAGALLGGRSELFAFGVRHLPPLTGRDAAVAALTGPLLSLLVGMAMQILQPFRYRGDFAHLLWIWTACSSLMLATVQLLLAPIGGDLARALTELGAPGWLAWVAGVFGVLGVFSVAREWAIHSTRLCGRGLARLLCFSLYPWLVAVPAGLLLAWAELTVAQVKASDLGAGPVDEVLVLFALPAFTAFAPLSLLLLNRVLELEEPLEVRPVPVAGLIGLAVVVGAGLALAGGVALG